MGVGPSANGSEETDGRRVIVQNTLEEVFETSRKPVKSFLSALGLTAGFEFLVSADRIKRQLTECDTRTVSAVITSDNWTTALKFFCFKELLQ